MKRCAQWRHKLNDLHYWIPAIYGGHSGLPQTIENLNLLLSFTVFVNTTVKNKIKNSFGRFRAPLAGYVSGFWSCLDDGVHISPQLCKKPTSYFKLIILPQFLTWSKIGASSPSLGNPWCLSFLSLKFLSLRSAAGEIFTRIRLSSFLYSSSVLPLMMIFSVIFQTSSNDVKISFTVIEIDVSSQSLSFLAEHLSWNPLFMVFNDYYYHFTYLKYYPDSL